MRHGDNNNKGLSCLYFTQLYMAFIHSHNTSQTTYALIHISVDFILNKKKKKFPPLFFSTRVTNLERVQTSFIFFYFLFYK